MRIVGARKAKRKHPSPFTLYLFFTRELIQKKGRRRVAFFFGNWEIKNLKKISRGRKVSKRLSIFLFCVSSFSESFRTPGDFDHQKKKKKKKKKKEKKAVQMRVRVMILRRDVH
jgi:hypothetical protein|tara:strand:- start:3299 stop:3640 length:342 start_codon:yes stop_codon:yes gene_type:complete